MAVFEIAVILINYNTASYTLESVRAVMEKTSKETSYQIIVVDNNSEPADFGELKNGLPEGENIHLHRSNINTGFGGGNMLGIPYANARYLLFLNNDAMLLNDCLTILCNYMEQHPDVGVCTAQNYDEHGNFVPSFDHNKGLRRLLFGRGFLEGANHYNYPKRKQEYTEPLEVNWVNGAFLFFRTADFEKIGGFDSNIFLYFEEMDLCNRLRKTGKKSVLVPEAKIMHYQGVSIGKSEAINKEGYISYLYVIRKNYGWFKYILINLYLILVILLKPKKWYLLPTLFSGGSLKRSLKHQQQERIIDEGRN